ncbi:peptidase inhibitor I78 [Ramlibacter sp. AW1]|uniref:Peptidase inhibitor I78 n=2 Tax=Ramlibacter aurantiacus TaxID=2801330 RepID=A0A936ZR78_9BURK|nr:peptidase inhibitor I78 [Ramlibacter aurantiacus]
MLPPAFVAGAACVLLQACAQPAAVPAAEPASKNMAEPSTNACDRSAAGFAIGQEALPSLLETARRQSGAETARFLTHDQVVTREYRVGRLNLLLDASGRVVEVSCG